jgi:hypothetical protein
MTPLGWYEPVVGFVRRHDPCATRLVGGDRRLSEDRRPGGKASDPRLTLRAILRPTFLLHPSEDPFPSKNASRKVHHEVIERSRVIAGQTGSE